MRFLEKHKQIGEIYYPVVVLHAGYNLSGRDQRSSTEVVFQGNLLRAQQDHRFMSALLSTGNKNIVEASPYDRRWGIGYIADEALGNKDNWGLNWLGECLMRVREEIREK